MVFSGELSIDMPAFTGKFTVTLTFNFMTLITAPQAKFPLVICKILR